MRRRMELRFLTEINSFSGTEICFRNSSGEAVVDYLRRLGYAILLTRKLAEFGVPRMQFY